MVDVATTTGITTARVLKAYLLNRVGFEECLALQRRFSFEISENRSAGVLILCEHPPGITIGRAGSAGDLFLDDCPGLDLPARFVPRGGGSLLTVPGQLMIYPIIALEEAGLNVGQYTILLHQLLRDVLCGFQIAASLRNDASGIWVGERQIAQVGFAVRDGVSNFGAALNVDPGLAEFRRIRCDGHARPMTSVLREHRIRVRPGSMRQRLLEEFTLRLRFDRTVLFHHHPAIPGRMSKHAVTANPR